MVLNNATIFIFCFFLVVYWNKVICGKIYHSPLDTSDKLELIWEIQNRTLYFELCSKGVQQEVIGLGFSDYGEVSNADIFLLWKRGEKWHSGDFHTNEAGLLIKDKNDDYQLLKLRNDGSRVCYVAKRLLHTCDRDDYQIDRGTTHVISFSLPQLEDFSRNLKDVKISLQRLQIIKAEIPEPVIPSDTKEIVIGIKNVEIPDVETTYWCRMVKLPELPEKHHIIRYEGVITPSSVGIVHHMEVFHCETEFGDRLPDYNAPCNSETKPMGLEMCRKVVGAWAMGASGITFPAEAGSPIGGPGYSRYVIVEVHFNNPQRKSGLIDSSGIRFFITKQLRPFDAGIMELGLEYNAKNSIPPGQHGFTLAGSCVGQCTSAAIPNTGINVFASQLHTHLTGRRVATYRIRDGMFVSYLNHDDHYSPHFQEIRLLPRPFHVKPDDTLITTCTYDTRKRDNMTFGGLAISDEMCVNYIHYYPKIDLEVCKSSVADKELITFFKRHNLKPGLDDATIRSNFNRIQWTKSNIEDLKLLYDYMPIHMSCNTSEGREINDYHWEHVPQFIFENEVREDISHDNQGC